MKTTKTEARGRGGQRSSIGLEKRDGNSIYRGEKRHYTARDAHSGRLLITSRERSELSRIRKSQRLLRTLMLQIDEISKLKERLEERIRTRKCHAPRLQKLSDKLKHHLGRPESDKKDDVTVKDKLADCPWSDAVSSYGVLGGYHGNQQVQTQEVLPKETSDGLIDSQRLKVTENRQSAQRHFRDGTTTRRPRSRGFLRLSTRLPTPEQGHDKVKDTAPRFAPSSQDKGSKRVVIVSAGRQSEGRCCEASVAGRQLTRGVMKGPPSDRQKTTLEQERNLAANYISYARQPAKKNEDAHVRKCPTRGKDVVPMRSYVKQAVPAQSYEKRMIPRRTYRKHTTPTRDYEKRMVPTRTNEKRVCPTHSTKERTFSPHRNEKHTSQTRIREKHLANHQPTHLAKEDKRARAQSSYSPKNRVFSSTSDHNNGGAHNSPRDVSGPGSSYELHRLKTLRSGLSLIAACRLKSCHFGEKDKLHSESAVPPEKVCDNTTEDSVIRSRSVSHLSIGQPLPRNEAVPVVANKYVCSNPPRDLSGSTTGDSVMKSHNELGFSMAGEPLSRNPAVPVMANIYVCPNTPRNLRGSATEYHSVTRSRNAKSDLFTAEEPLPGNSALPVMANISVCPNPSSRDTNNAAAQPVVPCTIAARRLENDNNPNMKSTNEGMTAACIDSSQDVDSDNLPCTSNVLYECATYPDACEESKCTGPNLSVSFSRFLDDDEIIPSVNAGGETDDGLWYPGSASTDGVIKHPVPDHTATEHEVIIASSVPEPAEHKNDTLSVVVDQPSERVPEPVHNNNTQSDAPDQSRERDGALSDFTIDAVSQSFPISLPARAHNEATSMCSDALSRERENDLSDFSIAAFSQPYTTSLPAPAHNKATSICLVALPRERDSNLNDFVVDAPYTTSLPARAHNKLATNICSVALPRERDSNLNDFVIDAVSVPFPTFIPARAHNDGTSAPSGFFSRETDIDLSHAISQSLPTSLPVPAHNVGTSMCSLTQPRHRNPDLNDFVIDAVPRPCLTNLPHNDGTSMCSVALSRERGIDLSDFVIDAMPQSWSTLNANTNMSPEVSGGIGEGAMLPNTLLQRVNRESIGEGAMSPNTLLQRVNRESIGEGAMSPNTLLQRVNRESIGEGAMLPNTLLQRVNRESIGDGAMSPNTLLQRVNRDVAHHSSLRCGTGRRDGSSYGWELTDEIRQAKRPFLPYNRSCRIDGAFFVLPQGKCCCDIVELAAGQDDFDTSTPRSRECDTRKWNNRQKTVQWVEREDKSFHERHSYNPVEAEHNLSYVGDPIDQTDEREKNQQQCTQTVSFSLQGHITARTGNRGCQTGDSIATYFRSSSSGVGDKKQHNGNNDGNGDTDSACDHQNQLNNRKNITPKPDESRNNITEEGYCSAAEDIKRSATNDETADSVSVPLLEAQTDSAYPSEAHNKFADPPEAQTDSTYPTEAQGIHINVHKSSYTNEENSEYCVNKRALHAIEVQKKVSNCDKNNCTNMVHEENYSGILFSSVNEVVDGSSKVQKKVEKRVTFAKFVSQRNFPTTFNNNGAQTAGGEKTFMFSRSTHTADNTDINNGYTSSLLLDSIPTDDGEKASLFSAFMEMVDKDTTSFPSSSSVVNEQPGEHNIPKDGKQEDTAQKSRNLTSHCARSTKPTDMSSHPPSLLPTVGPYSGLKLAGLKPTLHQHPPSLLPTVGPYSGLNLGGLQPTPHQLLTSHPIFKRRGKERNEPV